MQCCCRRKPTTKPPPSRSPVARRWCEDAVQITATHAVLSPLPAARGEVGSCASARDPGEGDSPQAVLVETAPHPNPLPAKSGARECTGFHANTLKFNLRTRQ